MKIVRHNCCGMDVHKNIIVATIGITDSNGITNYIQEEFSTLNPDLIRLKDWLLSHGCTEVCMESTGKYWIPIFNILEDALMSTLHIPNMLKLSKVKKLIKRIQNGYAIYTNMT